MDRQRKIDWSETRVPCNHRIWMSHVLLCLVWLKGGRLDERLQGFVVQRSGVGLGELGYGGGLYLDVMSVVGNPGSRGRSSGHG